MVMYDRTLSDGFKILFGILLVFLNISQEERKKVK